MNVTLCNFIVFLSATNKPLNMSTKQNQIILAQSETGLDDAQFAIACELHQKFPQIALRQKEVNEAEKKLTGKYFRLCEAIREPGEGQKLNGKEINLLLLSMGYPKSRASEMRKVIEVSDEVWEKYKQNVIGFRAVLAIARSGDSDSPSGDVSASEATEDGGQSQIPEVVSAEAESKVKGFPSDLKTALADALALSCEGGELFDTGKGYYEFVYMGKICLTPRTGKGQCMAPVRIVLTAEVKVGNL